CIHRLYARAFVVASLRIGFRHQSSEFDRVKYGCRHIPTLLILFILTFGLARICRTAKVNEPAPRSGDDVGELLCPTNTIMLSGLSAMPKNMYGYTQAD